MGIVFEALQRHGASGRIADQTFQLVTAMRWNLGVGMEGKAVAAGTADAAQGGAFPFVAKPGSNAAHLLAGSLPKSNLPLHRSGHGTGQFRFVVNKGIIALIEELWTARDRAKEAGQVAHSQAIKIIMNSFYGVLGTPRCRFFDPRLASSITMRGHEILQKTRDLKDKGPD